MATTKASPSIRQINSREKYDRTTYITEDGEIIPNGLIRNYLYKTIKTEQNEYKHTWPDGRKQTRIQTVKVIRITGRQLELF